MSVRITLPSKVMSDAASYARRWASRIVGAIPVTASTRPPAVSKTPGARVKWNVEGRQFTLWSPSGPEFGKAQVKLDGRVLASLDLHAERLTPSQPLWRSPRLKNGPHAFVLSAADGLLAVDSIEVTR